MNSVLKNGFVAYDESKGLLVRCDLKSCDGVLYADGISQVVEVGTLITEVDALVVLGDEIPREGNYRKFRIDSVLQVSPECYIDLLEWNRKLLSTHGYLDGTKVGAIHP